MTLKLFVADDSVTIQKIVCLAFSGEDIEIETASDGNSALESVQRFKPDIVLADVFMPGCSGYEVCARIKEDPVLKDIPVILLVGTFEPFDESEASRVKSDACLTKPFDTSELIQTVHSLAEKKEKARESGNGVQTPESSVTKLSYANTKGWVTAAAWKSFLGENRVLDVLDPGTLAADASGTAADTKLKFAENSSEARLSEDSINMIVDKVVRKMSSEVIREVAWEVVPELSEAIIRRTIQERK